MHLLFLHAFPFDPRMWERRLALAPGAEAPRLYELGETMDEWAEAILERWPGELVLVGASMGGYTAYHVARLAPERVRGLLTVGARAQSDSEAGKARRDHLARVTDEQGLEALWEELRPQAYAPNAPAEVVVYCHSGGRSQRAAQILAAAGYRARNYAGSWHEWSRREDLPAE